MSLSGDLSASNLRMTISRLQALMNQLARTQNEQARQIAELTAQVASVGQIALRAQLSGNLLSRSLAEGDLVGASIPILGSITQGIAQGIDAAQYTVAMQEKIRRGAIKFGTEADRRQFGREMTGKIVLSFFGLRTW